VSQAIHRPSIYQNFGQLVRIPLEAWIFVRSMLRCRALRPYDGVIPRPRSPTKSLKTVDISELFMSRKEAEDETVKGHVVNLNSQ
jgi:hypothetical protein